MSYKIIEELNQGTLVEVVIDGKPYRTLAVCEVGKKDEQLNDVVEAFRQSIINPPTITPFDNSAKKASGKQKLKDLGLDDDEIQALIGV